MQTPAPNQVDQRLTSSASWLYWVAGLSAINLVITMSGGTWQFAMGLGLTQVLSGLGEALGTLAKPITIAASVAIIATLCFLGYMACRGVVWAFVVGLIVLILDTLLLLPFASEMWLSIAFHVWAVISLFSGLKLAREA